MEKEFVPYKESLELKELGFDEPCFTYYKNDQLSDILELVKNNEIENVNNEVDDYISAPTFSQAFKFFREKYGLYHSIDPLGFNMCLGKVGELGNLASCNVPNYGTFKEAELACLRKLIEIVKNEHER